MITDAQLEQKMEEVKQSYDKMIENTEKAVNSKKNKAWWLLIRIASLALFVGCLYAGVVGFAGSSLVLGIMFLSLWFVDRVGAAIVGGFTAWSEGKVAELELEREKRKI